MNRHAIVSLLLFIALPLFAQKPVLVKPHARKNGQIVQPHIRTAPNKTKLDNYSTKGNKNPMTGKKGTKDPVALPKPKKPR